MRSLDRATERRGAGPDPERRAWERRGWGARAGDAQRRGRKASEREDKWGLGMKPPIETEFVGVSPVTLMVNNY